MFSIFADLRGEASRKRLFDFLLLNTDLPERLSQQVWSERKINSEVSVDNTVVSLIRDVCHKIIPTSWLDTLAGRIGVLAIFLVPPLYPLYEYAGKCFLERAWTSFGSCCVGIFLLALLLLVTVITNIKDFMRQK